MTRRIGITGPIGCGKSTVAGILRELGAITIDADEVAREVVEPGTPELAAVREAFGAAVIGEDGRLDRAALGRIVFADPEALVRLERIVHPAVRPRILAAITAAEERAARAVVIEAIKLVEGGLSLLCDEVWLVTCPAEAQLVRLTARGMDAEAARQRIEAQGDLAARLTPAATRVIETSGSFEDVRAAVRAAWVAATT